MLLKNHSLILAGIAALSIALGACTDVPTSTTGTEFQVDKLNLEEVSYLPEVAYHANEMGLAGYAEDDQLNASVTDRDGVRHSDSTRHSDSVRCGDRPGDGPEVEARLARILQSLSLSDDQAIAVRTCIQDYRDCRESVLTRARAARTDLYETFRAGVERLRNAVADGSVTREDAHRIYHDLVTQYRSDVHDLLERVRTALGECHDTLIECISSNLNADQLARFNELLSQDDHVRDGGDDNGGRDRDGAGNGGDDRGGDNHGGRLRDGGNDDRRGGDDNGRDSTNTGG